MKIVLIILIILLSYYIGFYYKNRQIEKYKLLCYLKNYSINLKTNINLFKNNFVKVTDDFIELQDKKTAKFNNIFEKKCDIYKINDKFIDIFDFYEQDSVIIKTFLNSIGNNEYEYENIRINEFITFLDKKIEEYSMYVKTKGELTLKLTIAIGCVISIIIW